MPRFIRICPLIAVAIWLGAGVVRAQEWTRFRGPNGDGGSEAEGIPTEWTAADYHWKIEVPGIGHSSPVIWGEKIFLTSAFEDSATRIVHCVDAQRGTILWQEQYSSELHEKHLRNSFASATPAVDQDRVYVAWSTPKEYLLIAFDHQGNEVWKRDFGPYLSQHSCGVSPIVYAGLVILGNDQDGASFLTAVDCKTGDTRWQTLRTTSEVAYSTPCVYRPRGEPEQLIFNSGAHGISSIDPQTGEPHWELDVFDKRSVSSPIISEGLIFGSTGSGGGGNYAIALRPGKIGPAASGAPAGGVASVPPEIAYRIDESAPYVPTLIAHPEKGLVFLWSDAGIVTCLRTETGEEVWRERVGGNYSGSPIRVQDRLYCIAEDGVVAVLAADEKYELLAKVPLGEDSRATPAVSGGRMYLRTYGHLFSLGGK